MAFITLSGTLLDPNGDLAVGDQIRFTHKSTTGETVQSAVSIITVNPAGTYSLPLQYGLVLVEYKDVRTQQFKNLGVATVNGTNPATSIPELLNALVPVSSAELIEFQAILADCVTAQTAAENAATTAEAFAYQLTTTDLIASTATFAATTNIPTSGFTTSGDGGNGSWKQTGLTAQTPSQSPSQLGDALLNDGNGNQWAFIVESSVSHYLALGVAYADADALLNKAGVRPNRIVTNQAMAGDLNVTPSTVNAKLWLRDNVTSTNQTATSSTIQREVGHDVGGNPKALRAKTVINSDTTATEWAVSAELDTSSLTNVGVTGLSSVVNKLAGAGGQVFGLHVQVNEKSEFDGSALGGSIIGAEMNFSAYGLDDSGTSGGIRIMQDLIAQSYVPSGSPDKVSEYRACLRINNSGDLINGGRFKRGIEFRQGSAGGAPAFDYPVYINSEALAGVYIPANVDVGFLHSGSSDTGVKLNGVYSSSAIQIESDDKIAFNGTSANKTLAYNASNDRFQFAEGAGTRFGLKMGAIPELQINGNKVLTTQQAAISDSVGGDEQAKINSILAVMRAHGLITT